MKVTIRLLSNGLGLAIFAAALTPNVFAGCGEMPGKTAPVGNQPQIHFMQAAYRPAQLVLVDSPSGADVVGFGM